ncbi:hypothetical protein EQW76_10290 [Rhizobium sp. rho-13.1]|nr:hypothetical protein EQW76_10290 [Rhizobium sp. rho-13.1]TQY16055.1 hypothetical protein EQW74_09880 [Rhizobium sp. rho-1.1]
MNTLGSIPALVTTGLREVAAGESLYTERLPRREEAEIRAVPYHLWDNRAAGEMLVWIRTEGGR